MSGFFNHPGEVVRCLLTYTDWWQPSTTSIYHVGGSGRDRQFAEGVRTGLLDHLDERVELRRRMQDLPDREREVLILWYVRQLPAEAIAHELRISRRQCFRRRARAIRRIIELGQPEQAA
jgi:DNA-directed RNA polymerase specialized sigma24 family protein